MRTRVGSTPPAAKASASASRVTPWRLPAFTKRRAIGSSPSRATAPFADAPFEAAPLPGSCTAGALSVTRARQRDLDRRGATAGPSARRPR